MSGSIVVLNLFKSDKMDQSDKYISEPAQYGLTSYLSSPGTSSVSKFPGLWDIHRYL